MPHNMFFGVSNYVSLGVLIVVVIVVVGSGGCGPDAGDRDRRFAPHGSGCPVGEAVSR